jgi:hypothetical protein
MLGAHQNQKLRGRVKKYKKITRYNEEITKYRNRLPLISKGGRNDTRGDLQIEETCTECVSINDKGEDC